MLPTDGKLRVEWCADHQEWEVWDSRRKLAESPSHAQALQWAIDYIHVFM